MTLAPSSRTELAGLACGSQKPWKQTYRSWGALAGHTGASFPGPGGGDGEMGGGGSIPSPSSGEKWVGACSAGTMVAPGQEAII